jgi:hypothetical protein
MTSDGQGFLPSSGKTTSGNPEGTGHFGEPRVC